MQSICANGIGAASQPQTGVVATNKTADTCCSGANFVILEHATCQVDVHSHNKQAAPIQDVPVVSGATAWDDPVSGETCISAMNEASHCGAKLDHSLLNPNQI